MKGIDFKTKEELAKALFFTLDTFKDENETAMEVAPRCAALEDLKKGIVTKETMRHIGKFNDAYMERISA